MSAAARNSPWETHLLCSSRLLKTDEASPEEILSISIPINILLSEMTSGNKYSCIFSLSCPFITVWLSFPRCQAHSPLPQMAPSLHPSPCLKGAVCPHAVTLIIFLSLLFSSFSLIEQTAEQEGVWEQLHLCLPQQKGPQRWERSGCGPGPCNAPARPLLDFHSYNERCW